MDNHNSGRPTTRSPLNSGLAPARPLAPPRARSSLALAMVRLSLIVALCFGLIALFPILKLFLRNRQKRQRLAAWHTHWWGRICCRIAGYHLTVEGPAPPPGSMLVPNHLGYVDIIALAACTPTLFVTKDEVKSWPLFGRCCRVFDHIFVTRKRARAMYETADQIKRCLRNQVSVCLFAEGTSSGGRQVLPFSPSFMQPPLDAEAPIVPVAMIWGSQQPHVRIEEDIAYWGDHVFLPHILRHLGLGKTTVKVVFCQPLSEPERSSRKEAAHIARTRILDRMATA